jgi:hypothetical protein
MNSVIWEDPPEKTRGPTSSMFTEEIRGELDARAGQWAVVYEFDTGVQARRNSYNWRRRWPAYEIRVSGGKIYARLRASGGYA